MGLVVGIKLLKKCIGDSSFGDVAIIGAVVHSRGGGALLFLSCWVVVAVMVPTSYLFRTDTNRVQDCVDKKWISKPEIA